MVEVEGWQQVRSQNPCNIGHQCFFNMSIILQSAHIIPTGNTSFIILIIILIGINTIFYPVIYKTVSRAWVPGGPARLGEARLHRAWHVPVQVWRCHFRQGALALLRHYFLTLFIKTPSLPLNLCHSQLSSPATFTPKTPTCPSPLPCPSLCGARSASPRSHSQPYLPCTALPTTLRQPSFLTVPTCLSTVAASLNPGYDSLNLRTALSQLIMPYHARELTSRTFSVPQPSVFNPSFFDLGANFSLSILPRHIPFNVSSLMIVWGRLLEILAVIRCRSSGAVPYPPKVISAPLSTSCKHAGLA